MLFPKVTINMISTRERIKKEKAALVSWTDKRYWIKRCPKEKSETIIADQPR